MHVLARAIGYTVLIVLLTLVIPFVLLWAVWDWVRLMWHGRTPEYFIPEHPDSQRAWIETMERGRVTQRKEEG